MRAVLRLSPFILVGLALLWGPLAPADADHQGIKRVPARQNQVQGVDGKAIYDAYCATCHGPTGRGNGPATRHLSVPVPDLTTIAVRDGTFSGYHVSSHVTEPNGDGTMPCWREILATNYHHDPVLANLATRNLVKHIESLQVVRAAGR
jgi:mono/diheme cytochrome c family protein